MRGKVAKRLRAIARQECGGNIELYDQLYESLQQEWRHLHQSGVLAKANHLLHRKRSQP